MRFTIIPGLAPGAIGILPLRGNIPADAGYGPLTLQSPSTLHLPPPENFYQYCITFAIKPLP